MANNAWNTKGQRKHAAQELRREEEKNREAEESIYVQIVGGSNAKKFDVGFEALESVRFDQSTASVN